MDFNSLMNESPKIMTVVAAIKNDPDFLNELKTNPQEALSKIGVELNEEELNTVQRLGGFEAQAEGLFNTVKGLFGMKDTDAH